MVAHIFVRYYFRTPTKEEEKDICYLSRIVSHSPRWRGFMKRPPNKGACGSCFRIVSHRLLVVLFEGHDATHWMHT